MQTIHCMCTVISLPFLFEPSVHSMSMFPDQHYCTPDRTNFRHQFSDYFGIEQVMQRSFFDEVMYKSATSECFCGHGSQNDGFVKVTDV